MWNAFIQDSRFRSTALFTEFSQRPLGFIDVGVRGGFHPLVAPVAGITAALGFEPDGEECIRLRERLAVQSPWAACTIEPYALYHVDGPSLLHLLAQPTNHSLLPPNQPVVERYGMKNWEEQ